AVPPDLVGSEQRALRDPGRGIGTERAWPPPRAAVAAPRAPVLCRLLRALRRARGAGGVRPLGRDPGHAGDSSFLPGRHRVEEREESGTGRRPRPAARDGAGPGRRVRWAMDVVVGPVRTRRESADFVW